MRALVTGGAGYLGSSLVDRLLAEGHYVDVVDDLSSGSLANLAEARASGGSLSFQRLDVRDRDVVDLFDHLRPEICFHLARHCSASASLAQPVEETELSLVGFVQVLEGCRLAQCSKIVAALPGADLYGELDEDALPVVESVRGISRSPLGTSSRAMLEYLALYRERHGLEFSALATGEVYGGRDLISRPGSVSGLVSDLCSGKSGTMLGDGSVTRDYVFIDDVVDAMSRASSKGGGLLLNVSTGQETTQGDLYDLASQVTGVNELPRLVPLPPGEVSRSALDPARAGIHLGWRPWTTLGDGLEAIASSLERPKKTERPRKATRS